MSENLEKYKETIDDIYLRTKEELWTMEFATIVLLLGAVLFITALINVVYTSFGNWFFTFIIYFAEIAALSAALYMYRQKVFEAVRRKISAMDSTHPGISAAYDEWRSKKRR